MLPKHILISSHQNCRQLQSLLLLIAVSFCVALTPVFAAPANDSFAAGQVISGASGRLNASNVGATRESGEPNHAGYAGGVSVWYRWKAPATKKVLFNAYSNAYRILLGIYTAQGAPANVKALTAIRNGAYINEVIFNAVAGTTYYIAVDGYNPSGNFSLVWLTAPSNDNFASALTLSGQSGTLQGHNWVTTKETGEPDHAGYSGGSSVWYRWTAPLSGDFVFDTIGSNFDTILGIYQANSPPARVASLTQVTSDADAGGNGTSKAEFAATSGTTYYIAVDGYLGKQGNIVLHWAVKAPDNDHLTSAEGLSGNSGTFSGNNAGATKQTGEPDHDGNPAGKSVWFEWSSYDRTRITFDTRGSGFDTVLAVYALEDDEAATFTYLSPVVSDDDSGGGSASKVSFVAQRSTTYYIAVDGYRNATGSIKLNWSTRPGNDNLFNALLLNGNANTIQSTNMGATKESGEPNHAGNVGGKSVWFQWVAPANGRFTIGTASSYYRSEFDTLLAVYTGSDVSTLVPAAGGSNDNVGPSNLTSRVTFNVSSGKIYYIAVDGKNSGAGAASGDIVLDWSFTVQAPANNNFVNAQALGGSSGRVLTTNYGANRESGEPEHGNTSVWFKWRAPVSRTAMFHTADNTFDTKLVVYKGGDPARFSNLVLIDSDDDGGGGNASRVAFSAVAGVTYHIVLTGYSGAMGNAALVWATGPVNDNFTAAQEILQPSGQVKSSNVASSRENGEPLNGGSSVWYRWTAPTSGNVTFDTIGSDFNTLLGIYMARSAPATVDNLSWVDSDGNSGGNYTGKVRFNAAAGTTYYIAIDGYDGVQGSISLQWRMAPFNDDFVAAQLLSGDSGTFNGTNLGAGQEYSEPEHANIAGGKSVWFRWTPTVSGYDATFETRGSDFDTVIAIYSGTSLDSLTSIASNNNAGSVGGSRVKFNPIADQTYFIAVDGIEGSEGNLQLHWVYNPAAPPPNDLFSEAQLLRGSRLTIYGGNRRATPNQAGEATHAGNAGGASVWYRWQAPAIGQVTVRTTNSNFDTLLGIYAGDSLSALRQIAASDDIDDRNQTSSLSFTVATGRVYYIAVDGKNAGSGAAQGDIVLNLAFTPAPPTISAFTPTSGPIGTRVIISGSNLHLVSAVRFNGTNAQFSMFSGKIAAIVPRGTVTGKIGVTMGNQSVISTDNFSVTTRTPPRTTFGNYRHSTAQLTNPATPSLSQVRLSTAQAETATGLIRLNFSGALRIPSVQDATKYYVWVNGSAIKVERVDYSPVGSITLRLVEQILPADAAIIVQWHGIFDSNSKPLSGSVQLTSR